MERKLFLSCQSYLYPLSSSSLSSDHGSYRNDSDEKYCHEILLDGMNLSIEPCENSTFFKDSNNGSKYGERSTVKKGEMGERSIGPAYFLPQRSTTSNEDGGNDGVGDNGAGPISADPSFCEVQFILHTFTLPLKGMTTPVKNANKRDLSEVEDQITRNDETILIANIDGNHFQVDLNQIYSIHVGNSEDRHSRAWKDGASSMSNTNLTKKFSSSLILEMPSCCFRIFTSELSTNERNIVGNGNSSLGIDDDRTKFDAVRTRLERLLSGESLLPFPLSYTGLISPLGQLLEPDVNHKLPGKHDKGNSLAFSRGCLHSYSQSWNDLIKFENALENPHPAASTREKNFKDTINNLMSRIPNQVSSSFIGEGDLTKTVEMYENKITTKIEEFDCVIENFWNEQSEQHKRNNKRRRDHIDYDSRHHDYVRRFDDILKDHKIHVISKHELFLLPLRG